MQYLVEGADKATGEDRTFIISADDEADLQKQVDNLGILVSNAEPWIAPASAPPVSYATPAERPAIPAYRGLQIASFILGVSCAVCYVVAGISLILAIASILSSYSAPPFGVQRTFAPSPNYAASTFAFITAFSFFTAGGIQHGLGAACLAVRDIARNSFR